MSKVQLLRVVVTQRLRAAAEEICGLFERTLSEYEEEVGRLLQDSDRTLIHRHTTGEETPLCLLLLLPTGRDVCSYNQEPPSLS